VLAFRLVLILFPGACLLFLSSWCLGILNSHRKFFLSYAAPVIWNVAIIVALIMAGGHMGQYPLAVVAAWASVAGSALQCAIQLPTVLSVARGLRPSLDLASENVRTVIRNFAPTFLSRGVVQISAYVDALLASLLPTGLDRGLMVRLWGAALSAAAVGGAVAWALDGPLRHHPVLYAIAVLGLYGPVYFSVASALGVEEASALWRRLRR
jgi:hypothetical protein